MVEPGHQLHPRLVLLADESVGGDVAVGEEHVVDLAAAHRVDPADLDPLDVGRHRDHRQALVLVAGPVRPAHEQDVVGGVRAGDPRLLPVDDVAAVVALGPAAEVADVGAGLGLGHRDRLDPAARDAAEDLLLELLGAEPADGARRDHADAEEPHRDQPAGELLAQQAHVDRAAAGAAVLLGDRDPEPPELGDPLVQLLVVPLAVRCR